ncbi:hypothetical protein [Streptomyces sp. NPDC052811]|uniref:hypothetical protein n=1 Tax=Streptomyces sp. NPDC052811 TaxID=3155731 RepID=UPI0034302FB1
MISTPYLLLLNRAAAAPHDATAVSFEFVIAHASRRDEEPEVVFVSAVHRLKGAADGAVAPCEPSPSAVGEGTPC